MTFLGARVHPREPVGSVVSHGATDYNCSRCDLLSCPDGVVEGRYRADLVGFDLNRQRQNPDQLLHPSIFAAKGLLKNVTTACLLHPSWPFTTERVGRVRRNHTSRQNFRQNGFVFGSMLHVRQVSVFPTGGSCGRGSVCFASLIWCRIRVHHRGVQVRLVVVL